MGIWELMIVAIGVSMDAFAIAICKGLSVERLEKKHMVSAGLWFGGAQALMPLTGYLLGNRFGAKYNSKSELAGGIILIVMGIFVLLEHTGIL